jgi:hypothetical protein
VAKSLHELLREGRELGPALAELGWDAVMADDRAGATTLLFVEHGRALATSRALDDVMLNELASAARHRYGNTSMSLRIAGVRSAVL